VTSADGSVCPVQAVGRFRRAGRIVLAFAVCTLSACGYAYPRTTHYGTYVSELCEVIGSFEHDVQRLGRMLGTYRPDARSRRSEQAIANILTAVIADSRHVVATLDAVGAPDISNGQALAAGMVATFDQIEQSDAAWRSELRTGVWAWPTASRVKREHLRTSIEALLLVGRQFERLPYTRERQDAMARSPVCRDVFGSVRVSS
jgi:hypothetical protein